LHWGAGAQLIGLQNDLGIGVPCFDRFFDSIGAVTSDHNGAIRRYGFT
jgi:hypothetical protein